MVQDVDAEIARMRRIIGELDALEGEFEKVKLIREIIKRLRARVDEAESRLTRTTHIHAQRHGMGDSQRRRNNDLRRTPLSRSQQPTQRPSSPTVSPSLQVGAIAPLSPSSHPAETVGPASTASSSPLSMSSSLDTMSPIGTSLQLGSRMSHPPGKAMAGESTEPDTDSDLAQHLQRENGDSNLREVSLATPNAALNVVPTNRPSQVQSTG